MKFSLSNLLAFKKQKEEAPVIKKIEYTEGTKFATELNNDLYLDFEELGGFPFVKTVILGTYKIKIKRGGCSMKFIFDNDSIELESDATEIQSNAVKNTLVNYTEIDFEADEKEIEKIKNNTLKEIIFSTKKKTILFNPLQL